MKYQTRPDYTQGKDKDGNNTERVQMKQSYMATSWKTPELNKICKLYKLLWPKYKAYVLCLRGCHTPLFYMKYHSNTPTRQIEKNSIGITLK